VKDTMSSRERLLTTINHQEPDRVPICFRAVAPLAKKWKNPFERVLVLQEFGVDDKLFIRTPSTGYEGVTVSETELFYAGYGSRPWPFHPDVAVRDWEDSVPDEQYTIVYREIETPKGTMRMAARRTEDWQVKTLPLASDYLRSRSIEYLIKGTTLKRCGTFSMTRLKQI